MTRPLVQAAAAEALRFPKSRAGHDLFVLLGYTFLSLAVLWPLASAPGSRAIPNDDVYGNIWVLAWVVRQLFRDPSHLFAANGFFPVPDSLAYTEPLLPQALQAAPLFAAGASPLLAHNLVLFLTFPISAFAMYLLAKDVTRSRTAAAVAGLAYAFLPYRMSHLVHLQSLSLQWLPLALLCLRRAANDRDRRHVVLLGLFAALQALSSGYYALLTALVLGTACLVELLRRREWAVAGRLLTPLVLAAGLSAVVFLPYRVAAARESRHLPRGQLYGAAAAAQWGASPSDYWTPGNELYAGTALLVLAATGVARSPRHPAVSAALAIAAVTIACSLGPGEERWGWATPFDWLRTVPGVAMLRTPLRLGVGALLAACLLAAVALASLPARRTRIAVAVLASAAVLFEVWPRRLDEVVKEERAIPAAAVWLASAPHGPVLELPWDDGRPEAGRYMYWSTAHWQPMVNGWGGFQPRGANGLGITGRHFPAGPVARELRAAGVRYLVIHTDQVRPQQRKALSSGESLPPAVFLRAIFGSDRIYEIDPAGPLEKTPVSR